ncbi:hypothetical protein GIB67_038286 [Kingdonia uniflora]|uniref:Uncharacterized protein n=1 Tax=Kingdonia uniflora TaxID=39325 RepID=A0A7J7MSZ0_9MAGN|nr:hypothetical protein GIB67_038286 [Kingdonia uniflora]
MTADLGLPFKAVKGQQGQDIGGIGAVNRESGIGVVNEEILELIGNLHLVKYEDRAGLSRQADHVPISICTLFWRKNQPVGSLPFRHVLEHIEDNYMVVEPHAKLLQILEKPHPFRTSNKNPTPPPMATDFESCSVLNHAISHTVQNLSNFLAPPQSH